MALIRHTFLPRSMFDMDYWYRPASLGIGPSTLDIFDPFDDLDRELSRNLLWLDKPADLLSALLPNEPKIPKKYRVTVDVSGFSPKSIKTEIKENKLVVSGSEGAKHDTDDYSVREFRKTYELPKNAESDKMVSFVTSNGQLVVEVPLKREEKSLLSEKVQIVDGEKGAKSVQLNIELPEKMDPAKVSVTCKDRDLIIKSEDKKETPDSFSQMHYYRRVTLPENTDFERLKCTLEDNKLALSAPLNMELKPNSRSIPIETANKKPIENNEGQNK
jgi:HSP20 family molecular chaperone IbpA